jgi:hypothetical protein
VAGGSGTEGRAGKNWVLISSRAWSRARVEADGFRIAVAISTVDPTRRHSLSSSVSDPIQEEMVSYRNEEREEWMRGIGTGKRTRIGRWPAASSEVEVEVGVGERWNHITHLLSRRKYLRPLLFLKVAELLPV